jgi:hypothetical protein
VSGALVYLPNFDVRVWTKRFQNVFSDDTHKTKAMQNGPIKTPDGCELGQDLKENTEHHEEIV